MSRDRCPVLWACAYGVSQYWAYGVGQDAVSQDATATERPRGGLRRDPLAAGAQ